MNHIPADDTVIYSSGKDPIMVKEILQNDIQNVVKWCETNQLTINTKKTKVMIFLSRHNIKKKKMLTSA